MQYRISQLYRLKHSTQLGAKQMIRTEEVVEIRALFMEHKQMCYLAKSVSENDMGICPSSCSTLFPVKHIALNISLVWYTGLFSPTLPLQGWMKWKYAKRNVYVRAWLKWSYQCSPHHLSLHHQCTQTGTPAVTGRTFGQLQRDLWGENSLDIRTQKT